MTKEQEEVIKNIKIYIHDWINESVDEDGYERYAIEEYDKEFMNDIETVLSMLKQKDKEIEKKDKIIDLMTKELKERRYIFMNIPKKEIKQYFDRKATNNG